MRKWSTSGTPGHRKYAGETRHPHDTKNAKKVVNKGIPQPEHEHTLVVCGDVGGSALRLVKKNSVNRVQRENIFSKIGCDYLMRLLKPDEP